MSYRIGIDAGSKTIKVVVLDESGDAVFSRYRRHGCDIRSTLRAALRDLSWQMGDIEAGVVFSGSASIGVASVLGLPFEQEVVATTHAVEDAFPEADVVVELGGEDSKIIYLSGGLEQRMNATCAGGTGGFIDTIAFMLGIDSATMGRLAFGSTRRYPIASRCAVFAQTDVRPLLSAGVSKADIAASALDAVVRQTLGGLACGRPLKGTVVFLGGPIEYVPYLYKSFCDALGLDARTGIKPTDAHLFTARGAALLASRSGNRDIKLSELMRRIEIANWATDELERLPPLFSSEEDLDSFRRRHEMHRYPKSRLFDARGPLYMGIDAGSTTIKLAVVDSEGALVYSAYEKNKGDALSVLRKMMGSLYSSLPQPCGKDEEPYAWIAHASATGYGEELVKTVFRADSGVVETAAHLRAAKELCPDVSFILDMGGQDVKALWIEDGQIVDAVLNEACSSGCGSFVEGTAYSLKSTPWDFADLALSSKSPLDLGSRCTVFMTSRVRHAQKIGASLEDIAAGIAYSVVRNAFYKVVGEGRFDSIGKRVVVQGGAFKSDAVLRAFELAIGQDAVRFDQSHLMGAIGAAFIARDRVVGAVTKDQGSAKGEQSRQRGAKTLSSITSQDECLRMELARRSVVCAGCGNACTLSLVDLGGGRSFVTGNRCDRGSEMAGGDRLLGSRGVFGDSDHLAPKDVSDGEDCRLGGDSFRQGGSFIPNLVRLERGLLAAYRDSEGSCKRSGVRVGIMNTLNGYESLPFWHRLLTALGFSIAVPSGIGVDGSQVDRRCLSCEGAAWETVPSESVCFAAKISHMRYFDLCSRGADAVLMPRFGIAEHCPVARDYAEAIADNLEPKMPKVISPLISDLAFNGMGEEAASNSELFCAIEALSEFTGSPLEEKEFALALEDARREQDAFADRIEDATKRALDWLSEDRNRRGIVLVGRPYHVDRALMGSIDEELNALGFAVIWAKGLEGCLLSVSSDYLGDKIFSPAAQYVKTAKYVIAHGQLDAIFLQSFGCGISSVSIEHARGVLGAAGIPCTVLKIDEIADVAHVRIRLRTLAEAIHSRNLKSEDASGLTSGLLHEKDSDTVPFRSSENESREHVVAGFASADEGDGMGKTCMDEMRCSPSGKESLLPACFEKCPLETIRREIPKDVCFTVSAMAACIIDHIRSGNNIETIEIPRVCDGCLMEALPFIVDRAVDHMPKVVWIDGGNGGMDAIPFLSNSRKTHFSVAERGDVVDLSVAAHPRMGIVGNALMCFNPSMNDRIIEKLVSLGCEVVLPDIDLLSPDDLMYPEQLEAFLDEGIRDVIYLQSFGCLKGHVKVKGALHSLKKRHPALLLTVIDFDPESSALNRENRIRLAVEAARSRLRS